MRNLLMILALSGCCSTIYLQPAESYNVRHEVKCKSKTYAQCINDYARVKRLYETQLDSIYNKKD